MKTRMILLSSVLVLSLTYHSRAGNNGTGTGGEPGRAINAAKLRPVPLPTPQPLPDLVFSKIVYEEGGKSKLPGFKFIAKVTICVKNIGEAKAKPFQVRMTIYKGLDESSGLFVPAQYFNFGFVMKPGEEKCTATMYDRNETLFNGRGRLMLLDPGNVGVVRESNEKNNRSWTTFPAKFVASF